MDPVLMLLVGIAVILVIIVANGFFVAQEFSFMSVDRARLQAAAKDGDAGAQSAVKVTRRMSFMLSGAQLGITITGLLVGYVAEPMVGAALVQLLGGTGIPPGVTVAVSTVGVLLAATVVQMIIGELYPKNLAVAKPEPMVRWLARPTQIYLSLFGWLIWVFDRSSEGLLRLVGIQPVHDVDDTATAEDLDRIVLDSRDSGSLPADLSMLIDRVLDFPERDVQHAMIPHSRVDVVAPEATVGQVRSLMSEAHTRYPVISGDHEPLGVVHLLDLLRGADPQAPVSTVMREPVIVPTLMPLPDAVRQLSGAQEQLACVIDEHGGFIGVITLEDLAEELVGDVSDEHDEETGADLEVESDGVWTMAGDVHLDELERALGHPLPEVEAETVSGLVIAQLRALPQQGQTVAVDLPEDTRDFGADATVHDRRIDVEVLELTRRVPGRVRVSLVETPREDDAGDEAPDTRRDDEARGKEGGR